MQHDDQLCLCFGVTKRKVLNFIKVERPRAASQLSECYGAGQGCGWCRPFLKKLFEACQEDQPAELPAARDYASARGEYVKAGKGTPPPGAAPVE